MFGYFQAPRTFTLSRLFSGISKTLNFANQVIPIYEQTKPLVNNARSIMRAINEFAHSNPKINTNKKTVLDNSITNSSNPVFFQ